MAEIANHEVAIQSVATSAQDLISSSHFAVDRIKDMSKQVADAWCALKSSTELRAQVLQDSLEVQEVSLICTCVALVLIT